MNQDLPKIRPDTITVSAVAEEECEATSADLYVVVRGASLFSGDIALKKAREVAALVAALAEVGVVESSIELRGIQAEVTTGTLGNKTSSATYSLRIGKVPLAKVPDTIGAITTQKNTDLVATIWQYGDDEVVRLRLLETALKRVQVKADLIARTLGVSLIGVRAFTETFTDEDAPRPEQEKLFGSASGFGRARARRVDADELGLAVSHRKKVFQAAQVIYCVSPIMRNKNATDS
ncbi:MAG: SIMPL domain-containing protein [Fibrella sp.]|nr:SIMPL domain-containing protein [Armatimonadota bacterium]